MTELQTCSIRDKFLINLNNYRNEIDSKFKQISDNLIIRQNQLLSELDGIEKKYLESQNAENLLKPTEEYRNELNKGLQGSFLPENIISPITQIIDSLDVQIAELRQKLVTFTNIDIKLDTDNINTLIDKLGSVKLTEDTGIPETRLPGSQYSSNKQSMVQYNTPFNLNKNECQINKVTAPNQDVDNNKLFEMADKRDDFLINLNNCRSEINTKFKQIIDNLVIRQNQLLADLDQVEKKYLEESGIIQDEIQKLEEAKNTQKNTLEVSFNFLQEAVVAGMKDAIKSLGFQIADLRQKLVTFTNIDIELDIDNINTLIDKLGSLTGNAETSVRENIQREDSNLKTSVKYATSYTYLLQIPGKTTLDKIETARDQIRERFRQDYEFLARKEAHLLRDLEDIENNYQARTRSEPVKFIVKDQQAIKTVLQINLKRKI